MKEKEPIACPKCPVCEKEIMVERLDDSVIQVLIKETTNVPLNLKNS